MAKAVNSSTVDVESVFSVDSLLPAIAAASSHAVATTSKEVPTPHFHSQLNYPAYVFVKQCKQ